MRQLLDTIRAFAIDAGGELVVAIGFDDFFRWPTTLAPGGSGNLPTIDWDKDRLRSAFSYHVGRTSPLSGAMRRAILDRVYRTPLGSDIPPEIRSKWGQPSTSGRLSRLAHLPDILLAPNLAQPSTLAGRSRACRPWGRPDQIWPEVADFASLLEHNLGCDSGETLNLVIEALAVVHVARVRCLVDEDAERLRTKRTVPKAIAIESKG